MSRSGRAFDTTWDDVVIALNEDNEEILQPDGADFGVGYGEDVVFGADTPSKLSPSNLMQRYLPASLAPSVSGPRTDIAYVAGAAAGFGASKVLGLALLPAAGVGVLVAAGLYYVWAK